MIRHLALKELREILLSPKFVVIFAVSTVLVLLSAYTGVQNYQEEVREYRVSDDLNREGMARGSWNELLRPGATVLRPPSPLSPLVGGVQPLTGRKSNIGADLPRARDSRAMHSPILAVFGGLDLAFVIAHVLSLFAVLLSFDTISGEKERGTLKLLLTGKASRAEILAGKLLGGYSSLVVPLAVPLLVASLYLALHPSLGWGQTEWMRFAVIIGLGLLYLAVFFALGVMISTLTSRPAVSFLILLLVWVGTVAIAPRSSVLMASLISPAPSSDQMLVEQETVTRELGRQRAQRITDAVNDRFREQSYGDRIEAGENIQDSLRSDVNDIRNQVNQDIDDEIEGRHAEIYSDFEKRQAAMTVTARRMARFSPTSAFLFASQAMAGTGLDSQVRFVDSVRTYRDSYLNYVRDQALANPDEADGGTMVSINIGNGQPEYSQKDLVHELDLASMPEFHMSLPGLPTAMGRALPDLAVLILLLSGTLVATYAGFRRYDPR